MSVRTHTPRAVLTLLTALLTAAVVVLPGTSAQATANRFWGYYQVTDGAWAFATTGPDQATPADGAVEGWRYSLATMEDPRFPRAVLTFDQICAGAPAEQGKKRVGVVLDYGRPADAADTAATSPQPRAACAVVPAAATGADVLKAVAEPRLEKGMVCGLDGYPADGCFEEVATAPAAAAAPDDTVSPSIAAAAGAAPSVAPTADNTAAAAAAENAAKADQGISASTWALPGLVALAVVAAIIPSVLRRRRTPATRA